MAVSERPANRGEALTFVMPDEIVSVLIVTADPEYALPE